jgi:hypothetical protein
MSSNPLKSNEFVIATNVNRFIILVNCRSLAADLGIEKQSDQSLLVKLDCNYSLMSIVNKRIYGC